MKQPLKWIAVELACAVMASCKPDAPQVLGTLEFDRITLPAPAAERITEVAVREGQHVTAGTTLLTLETTRAQAVTRAAPAQTDAQRAALRNIADGARRERIVQAQAQLNEAIAQEANAAAYYKRLEPLGQQKLVAAADVDRARAAASTAKAAVNAAQAALQDLKDGARHAELAQGEANVQAAQAQVMVQQVTQDKLIVKAPRDGVVDALPYKLGDQAPVGSPLAVILVGGAPFGRVYIPEPLRTNVKVGTKVRVTIDGQNKSFDGTIRVIQQEPTFTTYYALSGSDAARLSYLAEIQLGDDAKDLPAGLPIHVELLQ